MAIRYIGRVLLALKLSLTAAPQVLAQAVDGAVERVGPVLDPGHWAVRALRRADGLQLVPDYLPSQRALSLDEAFQALAGAAEAAGETEPELLELIEGWRERLANEFPGMAGPARSEDGADRGVSVGILGARAGLGALYRSGFVAPGTGEFEPDRTGALEVADERSPLLQVDAAVGLGERIGFRASARTVGDEAEVEALELFAAAWGARVTVGRSRIGYGPGFGGSVILGGDAALDAIQVATQSPLRVPGVQRVTGPISIHGFGGRMREGRHPDRPYVWGGSLQLRPHRRATLGVHRAGFFGGRDSEDPITARRIFDMLIGRVAGAGFEDQIVSASGRLALPTEDVLPLELYLEWGSEDAAGAWFDVPGFLLGLWSPRLPSLPAWSAGAEVAHFAGPCCSNPKWYRHWSFPGGWASRGQTLGHPIGGEGTELNVHARYEAGPWVWLEGRAFTRVRGEDNLYVPGRFGRSWGAAIDLERMVGAIGRLRAGLLREDGAGWAETQILLEGVIFR